ncbi:50S ribosomal protein L22 [Candidatus Roizmanbacteria bacterium CG10_big_fil_rev_8_21_14_0_10_39_6]|uniref:Large ribosomal subunit protein uL22 n=1 Tax=Candidatus Roizmanbacteria bacterium CG10_big_fil_rev_8_21_14_0_10_39_6 TaxID=1974853 RepID=A0A2M8KT63_9BACT|nr:MAG: 50S ribosomal protein L22 [Candidatus Roizmanbacteria bacterium CG10_big_fil_rev_8_21_14_0_10_39_6]
MEKKAIGKYTRLSDKKLRMFVDAYRGMNVSQAMEILPNVHQKAGEFLLGVIKSAINQFTTQQSDSLYIKSIEIDKGPFFKRWRPQARGMAKKYTKKTARIAVVISDKK